MTLVVARRYRGGVVVVADSLVAPDVNVHPSALQAGLKAIALTPSLCVAFAGSSILAEEAFRRVLALREGDLATTLGLLRRAHIDSAMGVDFILSTTHPSPTIFRIADGSVAVDLDAAWIGDAEAFSAFQVELHDNGLASLLTSETQLSSAMGRAMEAIIRNAASASVGGFPITLRSGVAPRLGFRYTASVRSYGFQPVANTTEETSLTRSLGVGGGSYNAAIIVPREWGVGALAIHVLEPAVGVLMFPAKRWAPYIYHDIHNTRTLAERVLQEHGIVLEGIELSA